MGLTRISTTAVVPKRNKFKVTMKADWFESVSASFASEGSLQNLAVTFGFVNKYPEWKTWILSTVRVEGDTLSPIEPSTNLLIKLSNP